jgi:hypothetical protein
MSRRRFIKITSLGVDLQCCSHTAERVPTLPIPQYVKLLPLKLRLNHFPSFLQDGKNGDSNLKHWESPAVHYTTVH